MLLPDWLANSVSINPVHIVSGWSYVKEKSNETANKSKTIDISLNIQYLKDGVWQNYEWNTKVPDKSKETIMKHAQKLFSKFDDFGQKLITEPLENLFLVKLLETPLLVKSNRIRLSPSYLSGKKNEDTESDDVVLVEEETGTDEEVSFPSISTENSSSVDENNTPEGLDETGITTEFLTELRSNEFFDIPVIVDVEEPLSIQKKAKNKTDYFLSELLPTTETPQSNASESTKEEEEEEEEEKDDEPIIKEPFSAKDFLDELKQNEEGVKETKPSTHHTVEKEVMKELVTSDLLSGSTKSFTPSSTANFQLSEEDFTNDHFPLLNSELEKTGTQTSSGSDTVKDVSEEEDYDEIEEDDQSQESNEDSYDEETVEETFTEGEKETDNSDESSSDDSTDLEALRKEREDLLALKLMDELFQVDTRGVDSRISEIGELLRKGK